MNSTRNNNKIRINNSVIYRNIHHFSYILFIILDKCKNMSINNESFFFLKEAIMTAINVIALPNNVYVFREPILVRELNTFAQEYDYPDMYQDGDKRALVITNMHIAYEFSRKFHTSFQIEHI